MSITQWAIIGAGAWILCFTVGGTWFFANDRAHDGVLWKRIVGGVMFFPALAAILVFLALNFYGTWLLAGEH